MPPQPSLWKALSARRKVADITIGREHEGSRYASIARPAAGAIEAELKMRRNA